MKKRFFKIIAVFLIGVLGGIFADQVLLPYFYKNNPNQRPVYINETKEIKIQENVVLTEAVEKVKNLVVGIKATKKSGAVITGSGLIISSDGLMVTLVSLAPSGAEVSLYLEDKKVTGQVLKRDIQENLALIKISESNLPTAGFGDFNSVKLGQRVFLMAAVFENDETNKLVNEGVVKIINKDYIKTNISESYSVLGSTLFDINGNILGLNFINNKKEIITMPSFKIKQLAGF